MIDDHERYQGVVLRQIVAASSASVSVRPFRTHGRINSFVLNGTIGVFVKHSTKRMPPWPFTFHADQISDLRELEKAALKSYVSLVCGFDGVVTLPVEDLHQIAGIDDARQAWVRIHRPPRSMYSVWGNRAELAHKVRQGVTPIAAAIALGRQ
jgi:hypothetical protein